MTALIYNKTYSNDIHYVVSDALILSGKYFTLPEHLTIKGNFKIYNGLMTHLPEGIIIDGSIYLNDCTYLTALPKSFKKLKRTIEVINCRALTDVPEEMEVNGGINFSGCSGLTKAPQIMTASDYINFSDCHALTDAPKRMGAGSGINFSGCFNLKNPSRRVNCGWHLSFNNCTILESLSEELYVGGTVNCTHCFRIKTISNKINIKGKLYVSSAMPATIPEEAKVGEIIWMEEKQINEIHMLIMEEVNFGFSGVRANFPLTEFQST